LIAAVPVELTDAALAAEVVDGLALVEKQLADATESEEELLAEASTHLLEAGGKRFRATLVLLASHFGNPRDPRVVSAATAVELTHLATVPRRCDG
jgi:heptaprenyl diphosphate synthase